jgi:microcystin-dependent protein
MKRVLIFVAITLLLPSTYLPAQSVPSLMNFQGQVLGATGSPLATGDYTLTFQIFDAAEGGNVIWGPQTLDGAGSVGHGPKIPVVDGYFNVILGPVDTASRPLTGAFLGATRFLEIKVGTNNPISPRQQILSAPYALNAANVGAGGVNTLAVTDGAVTTAKLGDGAVTDSKVADASISVNKLAQDVLDRLVPAGSVVAFGGSVAPAGWVLCDRSERNGTNAAFSALFAVIGKTYGSGDLSPQSFNLPDLRGRTVIGAGLGGGLTFRSLSAKPGTETITQVPSHSHGVSLTTSSSGSHFHSILGRRSTGGSLDTLVGSVSTTLGSSVYDTLSAGTHTHTISGNTAAAGVTSVDNLQPSLVLNYIIKL